MSRRVGIGREAAAVLAEHTAKEEARLAGEAVRRILESSVIPPGGSDLHAGKAIEILDVVREADLSAEEARRWIYRAAWWARLVPEAVEGLVSQ